MTSLVTSQSHFPKSITWFSYCCFLTSFVIACWILPPVITHQMNGHQISFRFTYALFVYDVTFYVTKSFSKSITRFSQIFCLSHLYEYIMHLTFGYDISNELAFNKLLFDVPFMWLWVIRDVTKLFSEIYNTIFIGLSVF